MIRGTSSVPRKRITYQTERVGTRKLRRVIVWILKYFSEKSLCIQYLSSCWRVSHFGLGWTWLCSSRAYPEQSNSVCAAEGLLFCWYIAPFVGAVSVFSYSECVCIGWFQKREYCVSHDRLLLLVLEDCLLWSGYAKSSYEGSPSQLSFMVN